jgi:cell division septation protein DedD
VLESRHLVAVFLVAVLVGCVFFTLGYVLGRSHQTGAKAAGLSPVPGAKAAEPPAGAGSVGSSQGMEPAIPPADWDFYKKAAETKPQILSPPALEKASKKSGPVTASSGRAPAAGQSVVQVAALKNAADARHLAARLKRKGYAAYVAPLGSDSYYRVQVGPFADARKAEAVRRKLEQDGFQAIVKH